MDTQHITSDRWLFIDSEVIESLYGSSFTQDLFNTELQPQPFINELQRLMKVLWWLQVFIATTDYFVQKKDVLMKPLKSCS